ncbi:MAG: PilN domain-containing protein [Alphaproteobacteria bacterium]|nr:PilN domain-containing protein [Alphaproteobacteria bacterium]
MQTAIMQAGGAISRFLAWWLGELGAMAPSALRRAFAAEHGVVGFGIAGDELVIGQASDGEMTEIARLNMSQPADVLRADIAGLMRKHAPRGTDIVLLLSAEQALHKVLDLPMAAEEGMRDLLYFELDRQTPYRPDQVRYDFRIAGRDTGAGRMKVELLVAPVEAVDRLMGQAREWGLELSTVTVSGLDDPADPAFDLSGGKRAAPSRGGRLILAMLALMALGLTAAAVWTPLEAQRLAALEAESALAQARTAAAAAANLRDELDSRAKAGSFLVRRKNETTMMTAVLADLTRLLPDDTWLFELHVKGPVVRARGYAPAASTVLELIERGPAFHKARFTSPVTRVPGIDAERFDLTFELAAARGNAP